MTFIIYMIGWPIAFVIATIIFRREPLFSAFLFSSVVAWTWPMVLLPLLFLMLIRWLMK